MATAAAKPRVSETLPTPVHKYLCELELAIKQKVAVIPEAALEDAREFLTRDYEALSVSEPNLDENTIYAHFVTEFGSPEAVAAEYESSREPARIRSGHAPGWRIFCTCCGRSAPAAKLGVTRIGAASWHKYTFGWCRGCQRLRWFRWLKDLDQASLTERLSIKGTGDAYRARSNHPWIVLFAILLCTLLVIVGVQAINYGLLRFGGLSKPASSPQNAVGDDDNALPDGWRVVKHIEVSEPQLSAISQKLGVPLSSLTNDFISDGETTLQLNRIGTNTESLADLRMKLQQMKPNRRDVIERHTEVIELVIRDEKQAEMAARARYLLNVQPRSCSYRIRFDVAPLANSKDDMRWNSLFNALLKTRQQPSQAALTAVQTLSTHFEFADGLTLARTGIGGDEIEWSVEEQQGTGAEDELVFQLDRSDKIAGIPTFAVRGVMNCRTPQVDKDGLAISSQNVAMLEDKQRENLVSPSTYWPIQEPRVQAIVRPLIADKTADKDKYEALMNWIRDRNNMRFDGEITGSRYGCLKVLDQGYGHCWDYSDLFISLCRAADLPARQVYGWLYDGSGHVWCEVWLDGKSLHVDPTTGFFCGSDYLPIALSNDGQIPLLYTSMVQIERFAAKP